MEGELDNTQPDKVTGWMKFAGMKDKVTFDLEGNLLRLARREYPVLTGAGPGHAEQDPETWWKAVCETLREIVRDVDADDLAALCVQGQGPSLVMIDEKGRPLSNTILWMDTRTIAERDELSTHLGAPVSPFASP